MSNFDYAVAHTLDLEGGFSDHPADPGGRTMYGVTERLWKAYCAERFPGQPVRPIERITPRDAIEFYRYMFWDALRLDLIRDRHIAAEIFDSAVNCGPGNAVRFFQKAINYNRLPGDNPIAVDGIVGPVTRGAAHRLIQMGYRIHLFKAMNGYQFMHYERIGNQHMSRGWTERIQLTINEP